AWINSSRSPATPTVPSDRCCPSSAWIICTSASTSGNCASRARKRPPASPRRSNWTWNVPCSSRCALPLYRPCRRKQLLLQAQANLDYYNKELAIFRSRLQAGGIARVDLDRMLLQRVQYESDYQGALTNARTAKITLRMMLNEQTPVDKFDVTGPF